MFAEGNRQVDLREVLGQSVVSGLYVYPIKSCGGTPLNTAEVVLTGIKHDRELMLVDSSGRFISQRDRGCEKLAVVHPDFIDDNLVRVKAPGMPELYVSIVRGGKIIEASVHKKTGIQVVDQGQDAQKWFGEYLGLDCQLVTMANGYTRQVSQNWAPRESDIVGFADGYNLLLISEESLADLNGRLPEGLPMSRFRPNMVISGNGIPYSEDLMVRIKTGDVIFDGVKLCTRCVTTENNQETGERTRGIMQNEPLSTLSRYRLVELKTGEKGPVFGQNLVNENEGTIRLGDGVQVLEIGEPPVFLRTN